MSEQTYPTRIYTGPDTQRTGATRWIDGDLFVVAGTGALWVRVAGAWQLVLVTATPSALTAANAGTLNTGDATSDTIINNLRTRLNEIEAKMQAMGLLT